MDKQNDRPVWLITGAAGALGSELVRQLLGAGKDCIALDRNARGLNQLHDRLVAEGLSPPALMPMDLAGAGPDEYAKLAETIESEFGRLDVLLHGAAEFVALRPLLHQPAEEWFKIIQTGVTGPYLLTVALMPLLSEAAEGRVVFVNDGYCLDNPGNWAAYGVAQAGRRQMVRSLEQESGRHGPRFVEVDPGPFFSPMRTAAWPSESPDDLPSPGRAAKKIIERVSG